MFKKSRRSEKKSASPHKSMPIVQGRVTAHRDGYGFLTPELGGDDLYVPQAQMHTVMHGDHISVRTGPRRRGKLEAVFHEVIKRQHETVIGRLIKMQNHWEVVPDNPRILHVFIVPPDQLNKARDGDLVVANIERFPENWKQGEARIERVLGRTRTATMETAIATSSFGLPDSWSKAVQKDLTKLDRLSDDLPRRDLTEQAFVTIDGPDAKDFDDAVFAQAQGQGWTLWVAIADVTHYVREKTALDTEARRRGTSVYFPSQVLPMLPKELSEDLCSLRPNVERNALVCEMQLDSEGHCLASDFYPAKIRSHARLTYAAVNDAVFERKESARKRLDAILPHLETLRSLYEKLHERRGERGALDFDVPELKFKFDGQGDVQKLVPTVRLEAHRLIEECMILANVSTASYLERNHLYGLFRVHDTPQEEKIKTLRSFVAQLGVPFTNRDPVTPRDCCELLRHADGLESQSLIERAMLRAQSMSIYSPDNIGHFGLALESYAHFTSPIRRYPDLLVHRVIRNSLKKKSAKPLYSHADMTELGQHCSMTERRADEAVWDVEAALKCLLVEPHAGKLWEGTISTVTAFGTFIELDDLYAEGLLHVTQLGSDYYHFDPETQSLKGEASGEVLSVGDRIKITIKDVNVAERQITLGRKSNKPRRRRRR